MLEFDVPIRDGRILVIGDPHAAPGYDNERFYRLGELARKKGATHVHCTGDWTDFSSLLTHGTPLSQEGQRVAHDVRAGIGAHDALEEGLGTHVLEKKTITLGNHDERPDRFVAENPQLESSMSWRDIPFEERGWLVCRYSRYAKLGPFIVSHNLTNAMGRPVGGKMLAKRLLLETMGSMIVGHDHRFQHWSETGLSGKLHAFVAGCCVHPQMRSEGWCAGQSHTWDIGTLWIDIRDGEVSGFLWDRWA